MDELTLVLTAIGAVAAIAAALFAYPLWRAARARPRVHLTTRLDNAHRLADGRSTVSLHLLLRNRGDGPAVGWQLWLISDFVPLEQWPQYSPGRFTSQSHNQGSVLTWVAEGADDMIEPGATMKIGLWVPGFMDDFRANYVIRSRGVDEERGALVISWPEDQEQPTLLPRSTAYDPLP